MSGYQSDTSSINDLKVNGNLPLDCLLGGFGVAASNGGNTYSLTLNPPLTAYKEGLLYKVIFQGAHFTVPVLSVNGLAPKAIRKYVANQLIDFTGLFAVNQVYFLIDRDTHFEIVREPDTATSFQYLFGSFQDFVNSAVTTEQIIGSQQGLVANHLNLNPIVEIKVGGILQSGEQKTLKVNLGNEALFEHTTLNSGQFLIDVTVGRSGTNALRSVGVLSIDNQPSIAKTINIPAIDLSQTHLIRFTGQVNNPAPGSITREMFIIKGTRN